MVRVLVLFDIDGTLLLRASAEHAAALREALDAVYGVSDGRERVPRGRAHRHGDRTRSRGARGRRRASASTPASRSSSAACAARVRRALPADASTIASRPACAELLDALARARRRALLAGHRQLRGGRAAQARARRDRPPLRAGQGGFGSDAEHRDELPAIARARAGGYPRERTIVIGDTPLDIACARADGAARARRRDRPLRAPTSWRGADAVAARRLGARRAARARAAA